MDNSVLFENNLVHLVARVAHGLNSLVGFVTNFNFANFSFVLFCWLVAFSLLFVFHSLIFLALISLLSSFLSSLHISFNLSFLLLSIVIYSHVRLYPSFSTSSSFLSFFACRCDGDPVHYLKQSRYWRYSYSCLSLQMWRWSRSLSETVKVLKVLVQLSLSVDVTVIPFTIWNSQGTEGTRRAVSLCRCDGDPVHYLKQSRYRRYSYSCLSLHVMKQ